MTMSPGLPPSSRALETEKGLLRGLLRRNTKADIQRPEIFHKPSGS